MNSRLTDTIAEHEGDTRDHLRHQIQTTKLLMLRKAQNRVPVICVCVCVWLTHTHTHADARGYTRLRYRKEVNAPCAKEKNAKLPHTP